MDTEAGYDAVAATYAEKFTDELAGKPFDTTLLDWLVDRVGDVGPICDMGCGPGQVAAHLSRPGVTACGIDLSAEMIRHAQRLHPAIGFEQGSMLDLVKVDDASFGGVAAFYSIVNIPPADHSTAFAELFRVLCPGGTLLISFHLGEGVTHVDDFLGSDAALDFFFLRSPDVRDQLSAVGFTVTEVIERDPYAESVEAQTRRAYIFGVKG